jgi:hypothetical protein
MRDLKRTLLFLSVAVAALPVDALTVSLRFDAEAGILRVYEESYSLPQGDWLVEMARFRAALARGEDCTELARTLGAELLGSAQSRLSEADTWLVEPLEMAPLSALRTPWSGHPVLEHATISYGLEPVAASNEATMRGSGILIVAPFAPLNDPLIDAPDTLQWEMMAMERHVELLPRNDCNRAGLAAVVAERSYALCWLRGGSADFSELAPVLPAAAPFLLWTHPMGSSDPARVLALAGSYVHAAGTLVVDLYRRSEGHSAIGCATLLQALSEGETAPAALRRARLELARKGQLRDWAGWICVGNPSATVEVHRPNWFLRLLRRRPSSAGRR